MNFSFGIRIVGFTSLILGVILLGICGWTFHKFRTGDIKSSTLNKEIENQAYDVVSNNDFGRQPPRRPPAEQALTEEYEKVANTYSEIRKQWKEFKPFLMGSGGVAIAAALVQIITCLVLLCSGPKGARERTGCFKMSHFIIAVALVVALVIPAAFDVSYDSWSHKLRVLFADLKREFHTLVFEEGFNPNVVTIYYSSIAADLAGLVILIFCTCCLMRNAEYDYREYP